MAYEELGVKEYVFVAVLDSRTSEVCQSNDNKKYLYKEKKVGVNYPPLHPNCRSTTRGYLGEDAEKLLKRRAKNPITGKSELIDNVSYDEELDKKDTIRNEDKIIRTETDVDNLIGNIVLSEKEHLHCTNLYNKYLENRTENLSIITLDTCDQVGEIHSSGNDASVGFSEEQLEIMKNSSTRSLIAIHNHPSNSTFSPKDIASFEFR